MFVVLFMLGAWVILSVPMGLLLGWACGLNQLSSDGGEVPIAATPASAPAPERRFRLEPLKS